MTIISPNAYAIQNASVIPNLFRDLKALKANTVKQLTGAIDKNLIVRCEDPDMSLSVGWPVVAGARNDRENSSIFIAMMESEGVGMTERSSIISPIYLNDISFADMKPGREVYEMAYPESKMPRGRYYKGSRLY